MRPIAARHGLTLLQLACQWNLAHAPVRCVAPTLIQEAGPDAKPIEAKRAELAALPAADVLSADEVAELRAIGDNTGSMALKGAAPGPRGRAAPRPLGAHAGAGRARGALGHRAGARPGAGMKVSLRGKLMLAGPTLKDPNFDRTVVLITEHTEDGRDGPRAQPAVHAPVAEAVPDLDVGRGATTSVFVGGPVAPNGVIVLAEWEDPAHAVVLVDDDLGFVPGDTEDADALAAAIRRARVYAGHAGWGRASSRTSSPRRRGSSRRRAARSCSATTRGPLGGRAAPQGPRVRAARRRCRRTPRSTERREPLAGRRRRATSVRPPSRRARARRLPGAMDGRYSCVAPARARSARRPRARRRVGGRDRRRARRRPDPRRARRRRRRAGARRSRSRASRS